MFNKNAESRAVREALLGDMRKLSPPHSYFSGACADEAALPDNIVVFTRSGGLNASTPTFHNRHVLVCGIGGQGDIVLDGTAFRFTPGATLLIHPFQFHHYTNIPGDAVAWLFITFDFPVPGVLSPLRDTPVLLPEAGWREAGLIADRYRRAPTGRGADGRAMALRLRLLLDDMLGALSLRANRLPPPKDRLLGDVCAHIHAHLAEGLGVEDIARALSISESHLRNRFRQAAGKGLGAYVRMARLHRACTLMHTSDATLSEVAAACGFESLYSFSRAFKHAFGAPPSSWRARTVQPDRTPEPG